MGCGCKRRGPSHGTPPPPVQVALAEQQYQLPRLKRMWSHLERQQGFGGGQGMGRGGMGEKQKEVDRRLIETSILRLRKVPDNPLPYGEDAPEGLRDPPPEGGGVDPSIST